MTESRWDWQVTCYYNNTVKPPKKPGDLAIQTVHVGTSSKDMEVQAARSRPDIGEIDVKWIGRRDRQ